MSDAFMLRRFERPNGRSYTVNYKYLWLAYLIEVVVVSTSLIGAWHFTVQYGGNNTSVMVMMSLAPVAYACVELARVPLAFALRTQTGLIWKCFLALMVLAAAGVTVKSLSQLGEIMFRPRMHEVTSKAMVLNDAKHERDTVKSLITAADELVDQRRLTLMTAEDRVKSLVGEIAKLPQPQCVKTSGTDKNGQAFNGVKCTPDPRVAVMDRDLKDAQRARELAAAQVTEAQAARGRLNLAAADKKVADAEFAVRGAVMDSQLHSFTAMFFGKSPLEVTDGEIHFFMRWFVFFPAIFAALTATALALASVTYDPKPKPKPDPVTLDERGAEYILDPLAELVTNRAVAAAMGAVAAQHKAAPAAETQEQASPAKEAGAPAEPAQESGKAGAEAAAVRSPTKEEDKVVPLKGGAFNG